MRMLLPAPKEEANYTEDNLATAILEKVLKRKLKLHGIKTNVTAWMALTAAWDETYLPLEPVTDGLTPLIEEVFGEHWVFELDRALTHELVHTKAKMHRSRQEAWGKYEFTNFWARLETKLKR